MSAKSDEDWHDSLAWLHGGTGLSDSQAAAAGA
jgi:hypothetical protein